MPPNTVSVCRPGKFGNPHHVGYCPECGKKHNHYEAVAEFEAMIAGDPLLQVMIAEELKGKNLACWCPVGWPCHADVLLKYANATAVGRSSDERIVKNKEIQ
jgi:hypothetical protein